MLLTGCHFVAPPCWKGTNSRVLPSLIAGHKCCQVRSQVRSQVHSQVRSQVRSHLRAIFAAKLAAKFAANRMQRWSCPSDAPIVPTCDNFPDKPAIMFKTGSEAMSAQRRQRLNAAEKHTFRRHVLLPAGPLPSDPSSLEHALPKKEKKSSVVELWLLVLVLKALKPFPALDLSI